MKNKTQCGDVLTLTAPSGGVTSGTAYLIGGLLAVATISADAGDDFTAERTGVFTLPKTTSQAWTQGQLLFWDDANSKFTNVAASGLVPAGAAVAAAASADTTGSVLLLTNPVIPAANEAALDQTISGTYTQSEVQAISDKVDAILTALVNAGLMAPAS